MTAVRTVSLLSPVIVELQFIFLLYLYSDFQWLATEGRHERSQWVLWSR